MSEMLCLCFYVLIFLFSGHLLCFLVLCHVFRFLSCFFPCHLVHSSHLFSVPLLHVFTNHLPTVYSFLVSLTHCKILTLPFMPCFVRSGFLPHSHSLCYSQSCKTIVLLNHSLVLLSCCFLPQFKFFHSLSIYDNPAQPLPLFLPCSSFLEKTF